jgi:RND family efflux transporter MFP subunit
LCPTGSFGASGRQRPQTADGAGRTSNRAGLDRGRGHRRRAIRSGHLEPAFRVRCDRPRGSRTDRPGGRRARAPRGAGGPGSARGRAGRGAASAALDLARRNRARFERLESRGAAAAFELDRARQEEANATAAAASAGAALRRAEIDTAQTVLTAPFDAVVVERFVSPGDLAGPGRPLVRIASLSGRRVEAAPAEQDAAALEPGGTLEVVVGGRTVTGRIVEIVGTVDPWTRRRTVRVDLPAGFEPALGSFARVVLPGPAVPRLFAPASAVVARGGLEIAWAVDRDGRVALRYVRTGSRRDGNVEVLSGLEAGERVVLDPPADLEAGTRVTS